jgi:hypothetical protein
MLMQGLPEGLSINVADLAEHGQEALTEHAAEHEVRAKTMIIPAPRFLFWPAHVLQITPWHLSPNLLKLCAHLVQNKLEDRIAIDERAARRLSTMRLQRIESAKLVEFPETVEGFFGKVRWYSFLFTMQVS